jgi:ATP-dependent RNA helicase DDX3X
MLCLKCRFKFFPSREKFKHCMNANQNEVGSSTNKDDIDSLYKAAGRYVPPHERKRMQEQAAQVQAAAKESTLSDSRGGGSRPWDQQSRSSGGFGKPPASDYGRGWSSNNLNSSGGVSKWNDRGGGSSVPGGNSTTVYGEDGLCPANPRLETELFGQNNTAGINFEKYNDLKVEREGADIPECLESFLESDLGPVLNHNVRLLGYTVPTPIQKNAIPIVMNGRDLMACAQTGTFRTFPFAHLTRKRQDSSILIPHHRRFGSNQRF